MLQAKLPFQQHFGDVFGPFFPETIVREIERNQGPTDPGVPGVMQSTRTCKTQKMVRK
jgi:hypothetical protein